MSLKVNPKKKKLEHCEIGNFQEIFNNFKKILEISKKQKKAISKGKNARTLLPSGWHLKERRVMSRLLWKPLWESHTL